MCPLDRHLYRMPMSRQHIDGPLQPMEAFGQVVRERRLEMELSQTALGRKCGFSQEYISGIERGKRNPTLQSMWTLAEGLGQSPQSLLGKTEKRIEEAKDGLDE
jgi:transcriptional regulator with XRE-family HTH domain